MRRFLVAMTVVITSGSVTGDAAWGTARETDGAVYIASNGAGGNEILVFDRNERGSLSFARAVPTGGFVPAAGLETRAASCCRPTGGGCSSSTPAVTTFPCFV
jgi:hypothetical protein